MERAVTTENLYKLVEHQIAVLDMLASGALSRGSWHGVVKDIFLASGGLLSPRVWRAVRLMTEYGLYESQYYVQRLYLLLIEEFHLTVQAYLMRGWITPTFERPLTTIQAPRSLDEELSGEGEE